jgi:hypothetical protein
MKVYLCWQETAFERKLLGVFAKYEDANDMLKASFDKNYECEIEQVEVIE